MGNCCGSQSSDDNFQGQGRTLGATPTNAPPQTDGARAAAPPKISAPKGGRSVGKNPQVPGDSIGPREAAAKAAEERAKSSQAPGGKLDRDLKAQQRQTQTQTLAQGARDNLAARDADAQAQARNYD